MWNTSNAYNGISNPAPEIPIPIQNENSAKDFAFQHVVSLKAGHLLLKKMESAFENKNISTEKQGEITQIFNKKAEEFEKLLNQKKHECHVSSQADLSAIDFHKQWSQKKAFEKQIHRELTRTFSQALQLVDPETKNKITQELGIQNIPFNKAIQHQFDALKALTNSNLTRKQSTFRGHIKFNIKTKDGGSKDFYFHDDIHRVDTADFLLQQAKLKQSEQKSPDENGMNSKIQFYTELRDRNAWRSTAEANKGIEEKVEMSTNAWVEKLADAETQAPFAQIVRSGAFTHIANADTNIRTLIEENRLEEAAQRKEIIQSQFAAVFLAQVQPLAKELKTAIEERQPNLFYDTKTLPYSQVSLLHTKGPEGNMLRDIEWLFRETHKKEVIFDGQAGFDKEGNIHVPEAIFDPKTGAPLRLNAALSLHNFNVQGTLLDKNTDYQQQVNREGWRQARLQFRKYSEWVQAHPFKGSDIHLRQLEDLETAIQTKLNQGTTNYEIGVDIAEFQRLMEVPVGVNCKSGKDRSSYLINLLMIRKLDNHIRETVLNATDFEADPASVEQSKKEMRQQVLKNGAGLFITGLNTGFKAYKITRFFLEGLKIDERLKLYFLAYKLR